MCLDWIITWISCFKSTFIFSWIEFWFVNKEPKYLKVFTIIIIIIIIIIMRLTNMVPYIKGEIQAKGTWKEDPGANISAQEGWEWEVEKVPQWGTSLFVPFT